MEKLNVSGKQNYSVAFFKLVYALVLLLFAYYIVTRAFPMLIISEDNYGRYFYHRAAWLFPHVILGILASIIGPFQFVKSLRNKYMPAHRLMGKVYIVSVILSGISGMYLAWTSDVNLAYAVGLFGLGFAWASSGIMAYISVKNKKIDLHKDWMIRSYVITLAFLTFRFVEDILMSLEIGTREEVLTLVSWASWAIPLFIAEMVIQGARINK